MRVTFIILYRVGAKKLTPHLRVETLAKTNINPPRTKSNYYTIGLGKLVISNRSWRTGDTHVCTSFPFAQFL